MRKTWCKKRGLPVPSPRRKKRRSASKYDKYHHARKPPKMMSAETKAKLQQYWADRKFKIANN